MVWRAVDADPTHQLEDIRADSLWPRFGWWIAWLNFLDHTTNKGFASGTLGEHRLRYRYLRFLETQNGYGRPQDGSVV
jgi:hypothetical protein